MATLIEGINVMIDGHKYKKPDRKYLGKFTGGRCYKCGLLLIEDDEYVGHSGMSTREHLIPRAIAKLYADMFPSEEDDVASLIVDNPDNIILCCNACNQNGGPAIVKPKEIEKDYIDKRFIQTYRELFTRCKPYIDFYNSFTKDVMCHTNDKCYICYERLTEDNICLRRLDKNYPRSIDNCRAVCLECNSHIRGRTTLQGYKRMYLRGFTRWI